MRALLLLIITFNLIFDYIELLETNKIKVPSPVQSITLIYRTWLYRNSRILDWEFQSRTETVHSMFFLQSGIRIYRTLNLSPNPSPV